MTRDSSLPWPLKSLLVIIPALFLLCEAGERAYWARTARLHSAQDAGTYEIFVVGESSAYGEPYGPSISFPKITSLMFGGRIAGKDIRIRNLAESGSTLYPQVIALEREIRHRRKDIPGVVFIYSGHNEGGVPPNPSAAVTALVMAVEQGVLRHSAVLAALLLHAERAGLVYGSRDLDSYQRTLRRAVEDSLSAGLTPIASTVIGNVSGIDPSLGANPPQSREEVLRIVTEGERLETRSRFDKAISYYRTQMSVIAKTDSLHDYLLYRIGKCYESQGRYQAAKDAYWEVIDSPNSGGFGRASSAQNAAAAEIARDYSIPLVDAVAYFEKHASHGLVGNQFFCDGHHPNILGYILLARAFGKALSELVHEPMTRLDLSQKELFTEFGFTPIKQAQAHLTRAGWLLRHSRGHLYPKMRLELARAHIEEARGLGECRSSVEAMAGAVEAAAAGSAPSDDELSRLERIVKQCSEPASPRYRGAKLQLALHYQEMKDYHKALALLKELTAERPKDEELLVSRGVCEYLAGSSEKAVRSLQEASRLNPGFLPAYLSLGYIYEEQRRYRLAVSLYHSALWATADLPADPMRQTIEEALRRSQAKAPSTPPRYVQ